MRKRVAAIQGAALVSRKMRAVETAFAQELQRQDSLAVVRQRIRSAALVRLCAHAFRDAVRSKRELEAGTVAKMVEEELGRMLAVLRAQQDSIRVQRDAAFAEHRRQMEGYREETLSLQAQIDRNRDVVGSHLFVDD